MSDRLDQSLDEILKDRRTRRPGPRGRVGPRGRRTVVKTARTTAKTAAPANGVRKSGRDNNKESKDAKLLAPPAGPSGAKGGSKILVSGLPADVTQDEIKKYFSTTIGQVKNLAVTYGPDGKSRGSCTVTFSKPASAAQAAKELNGVRVDGRPLKIEVVVDAGQATPAKSLSERIVKPKPVTVPEKTQSKAGNAKATAAKKGPTRNRQANRRKVKTTDELDAEMTDYFGGGTNGTAIDGAAVQATTANGGDAMEDEIM